MNQFRNYQNIATGEKVKIAHIEYNLDSSELGKASWNFWLLLPIDKRKKALVLTEKDLKSYKPKEEEKGE